MTTTARTFQNAIGGTWQPARSGQTFPNYNPATGELLGYFPLSGEAEANDAVAAARAAFETWRLTPAPRRGEMLFRAGELMKKYKEDNDDKICLPVFIDATCSGIQHLSAMVGDYELAKEVNLSDDNFEINDIYQKLVDPINNALNYFGRK